MKRFKAHGEKDRGWKSFGGILVSNESKAEIEKQKASSAREQKKIEMAKKAVERYRHDPDYRFLHERVSNLFADCLKLDLELLNTGN